MRHVQGGGELHAYRHRGRNKNNSQGNIFLLLFLAASRAGGKDLALNCLQENSSAGSAFPWPPAPREDQPPPQTRRRDGTRGARPPEEPLSIPGSAQPRIPSDSRCLPSSGCTEPTRSVWKARGRNLPTPERRQGPLVDSALCLLWPRPPSSSSSCAVCFGKPRPPPCQRSPAVPAQAKRGKPEARGMENREGNGEADGWLGGWDMPALLGRAGRTRLARKSGGWAGRGRKGQREQEAGSMARAGCRGGSPSAAPGSVCGSPVGVCSPQPRAGGSGGRGALLPSWSKQGMLAEWHSSSGSPRSQGPSWSVAGAPLGKIERKWLFQPCPPQFLGFIPADLGIEQCRQVGFASTRAPPSPLLPSTRDGRVCWWKRRAGSQGRTRVCPKAWC